MSEHGEGCDGRDVFSDGIFYTCYCKAIAMNTFAGAKFRCTIDKYNIVQPKSVEEQP